MRDIDIRLKLRERLEHSFVVDDPNCIVRDELGLCQGSARIDIAVINGSIHGYEIKSEQDNLKRFSAQFEVYAKVFDYLTFVTNKKYLAELRAALPKWCGIVLAKQTPDKGVTLQVKRIAKRNRKIDKLSLVQLLWRDETLNILRQLGASRGLESKPRKILWEALAEATAPEDLNAYVRQAIKNRPLSWL